MGKSLMVQGTMSNSGKSFLVAGLCRIFRQDGYRVAPFKSQNMALNSFITKEGLEIGRAQVMQAEAAEIEPSVLMNPILLKPTNDTGSQVIVNGRVMGNMNAMDYYRRKPELIPKILESYRKLSEQYEIIVLEGAGSPAEINLRENDIVNMGMAELSDSPVLLVGDIDRGGVFASLYGTVELLRPQERKRVKGFIINKFRGDKKLLEPGLKQLEQMTKIPVLGVIPYSNIDLDDEDSLTERFSRRNPEGLVKIAVICLPHISNFTDFSVLESMSEVDLYYAKNPYQLGKPDLIILPGQKNTMGDLKWLRESGMESCILKLHADGIPLFGICGGFQMLGEELCDPFAIEEGGILRGMGILPGKTVFSKEKVRTRVSGRFQNLSGFFSPLSGAKMEGYEIHMGTTNFSDKANPLTEIFSAEARKLDGTWTENCCGTYVHGIFDTKEASKALLSALLDAKGISCSAVMVDRDEYKQKQYNFLADILRQNLDLKAIYRILEKEDPEWQKLK